MLSCAWGVLPAPGPFFCHGRRRSRGGIRSGGTPPRVWHERFTDSCRGGIPAAYSGADGLLLWQGNFPVCAFGQAAFDARLLVRLPASMLSLTSVRRESRESFRLIPRGRAESASPPRKGPYKILAQVNASRWYKCRALSSIWAQPSAHMGAFRVRMPASRVRMARVRSSASS